jgi:hypothetical protein
MAFAIALHARIQLSIARTRGQGGELAAAEARIAIFESMHGASDEHRTATGAAGQ